MRRTVFVRPSAAAPALIVLSLLCGVPLSAAIYHVSPAGSDASPGTLSRPFATWQKGHDVALPGDLIYIHGGVYRLNGEAAVGVRMTGRSGEPGRPIRFWAYPGERPVLDCSGLTNPGHRAGIHFSADWWHLRGLEICGVAQPSPDGGAVGLYASDCNHTVFEQLDIHHNGGPGMYLSGNSNANLILNSDFHHNWDPLTKGYEGGNADGLDVGYCTGKGNIVRGCRAWWNSDDGFDLWETEEPVVIETCWAFWNGYKPGTREQAGDGNGFKLGRNSTGPRHIVRRSLAFSNRVNGFDENGASGPLEITNNTGYANGGRNFQFGSQVAHQLRNNLSVRASDAIGPNAEQGRNWWHPAIGVGVETFLSTDPTGADGPRRPGGGLPRLGFLRPRSDAELVDAGLDVGLPFSGLAPDLGAYEAGVAR